MASDSDNGHVACALFGGRKNAKRLFIEAIKQAKPDEMSEEEFGENAFLEDPSLVTAILNGHPDRLTATATYALVLSRGLSIRHIMGDPNYDAVSGSKKHWLKNMYDTNSIPVKAPNFRFDEDQALNGHVRRRAIYEF